MESIQHFISSRGMVSQILIYGFIVAYGYNILSDLFQLFQIWKGITRLKSFIKETKKPFYKMKRQMLLSYFPIISRYLGDYSQKLTYYDDDYMLRKKAIIMYNSMLSIRDCQKHALRGSFNPILGIKTFVTFPTVVLSWFKIRISIKQGITITIILGIATYLLDIFKPEVKYLLIQLFEQLIQTQKS